MDVLAAHGVYEIDRTGEQRYGTIGIAAPVAIFKIAADGTSYGAELDAYLVLAAS